MSRRKNHSPEFKAKVALQSLRAPRRRDLKLQECLDDLLDKTCRRDRQGTAFQIVVLAINGINNSRMGCHCHGHYK